MRETWLCFALPIISLHYRGKNHSSLISCILQKLLLFVLNIGHLSTGKRRNSGEGEKNDKHEAEKVMCECALMHKHSQQGQRRKMFGSTKDHSVKRFFKELFFYLSIVRRTIFLHREPL